jgi:uncharacterized membrane protein
MSLDVRNFTALLATLATGLLTGIMAGTGLAQYTASALPEAAWTLRFQLEDRLFSKAMPPLMLGTLLALFAACLLAGGRARWLLGAGALLMLLVLVVTVGFEVPLNRQIQSWTAGSAPPEWTGVRDLWLQRHVLRSAAAALSFVCTALALIL